ncbi:MAG: SDR family NAD(P)-dependent oxidoreductase [Myxococcota bacterium]|nr:SDR family NAD(P)-dependent oxidoreductase [Myxococcota bacterium]
MDETTNFLNIPNKRTALIVGARGGLGQAFCERWSQLDPSLSIVAASRNTEWCAEDTDNPKISRLEMDIGSEESVESAASYIRERELKLNVVINCSGLLHTPSFSPERALKELSMEKMRKVFEVNTFGVAMLLKYFVPLFPRNERTIFASCSARVGSIGDNRLGGWYSYRASKAAQNMMIRTAAIEVRRLRRECICIALHPGTVISELSAPFTKRKDPSKLFSPDFSATKLTQVLEKLSIEDSGEFFAYDGSRIEW